MIAVSKTKTLVVSFAAKSEILVFGILEICIDLRENRALQTIFVQFTYHIYDMNKRNYLKMFSKKETFRYASKKEYLISAKIFWFVCFFSFFRS